MRWGILLCVILLGCDDALPQPQYADGAPWSEASKAPAVPLEPGRVSPRDMDDRQWNRFVSQSGIQADREPKTFTPTNWTGFSVDPTGDVSYMDFGAIVIMWIDSTLTGTSDDVGMSFAGIPTEIRPRTGNKLVRCLVVNGGYTLGGAVEITTTGIAQFYLESTLGGGAGTADDDRVTPSGAIFENVGTKGLPAGWLVFFSKL